MSISTIDKPGIYRDFPIADYHNDPCPQPSFSQSIARVLVDRSPAHARLAHPRLAPPANDDEELVEKYDKAKAIGAAAHVLMLGRGRAIAECPFDSWRSKDAQAARARAELGGEIPILSHHLDTAKTMLEAAVEQLPADAFLHGQAEVMLAWQEASDAQPGLWCRALIDWHDANAAVVWDYKSTGMSVAPHALPALLDSGRWDMQAAMHARGLQVLGLPRHRHFFVAQETSPPYALTVSEIDDDVMAIGAKKIAFALERWEEAITSGEWPAYPAAVQHPLLPPWSEARWLDREIGYEAARRRGETRPRASGDQRPAGDHLMAG